MKNQPIRYTPTNKYFSGHEQTYVKVHRDKKINVPLAVVNAVKKTYEMSSIWDSGSGIIFTFSISVLFGTWLGFQ